RVAPDTLALMRELAESGELQHLTAERSWKEISRALMEPRPDVFIRVLRACGALAELLPEVDVLFGVPQPEAHHPEVDTGEHLLLVLQQAARMQLPLPARWACLLHDLGKGRTPERFWPKHHGHEKSGLAAVKAVNQRCKAPRECQELALLTCEYHTHCHRALELKPATLLQNLGNGRPPARLWPKHHAHEQAGLAAAKAVNQRCKAPRECQELALLTGEYHTHCHRALELKPATLLKLFKAFDIYRRPERFELFLGACEADARGRAGLEERDYPQADYLRGAANAARSAEVRILLEQGFKGAALGAEMEKLRLQRITEYCWERRAPAR